MVHIDVGFSSPPRNSISPRVETILELSTIDVLKSHLPSAGIDLGTQLHWNTEEKIVLLRHKLHIHLKLLDTKVIGQSVEDNLDVPISSAMRELIEASNN